MSLEQMFERWSRMEIRGMRETIAGVRAHRDHMLIDAPCVDRSDGVHLRTGERAVTVPMRGWFVRHMRAFIFTVLACAVVLVMWGTQGAFAQSSAQGHAVESDAATEAPRGDVLHYTVRSGDTLWSISRWCGYANAQDGVDALMAMNGLETAELKPGQHLVLPM